MGPEVEEVNPWRGLEALVFSLLGVGGECVRLRASQVTRTSSWRACENPQLVRAPS